LKQRVLSAIVLVAIMLSCLVLSPVTRILFFAVTGLLCTYEYSRCWEKRNVYCCAWVMYTYISIQAILTFFHAGPIALIACFAFAVYLALFSGILHPKVTGSGALATLAGVSYPCFLISLMMVISVTELWKQSLMLGFIPCLVCDTFALFGGKRFGKHKVAPHVSPNKTIEGCLCGALSSIVAGILIYFVFPLIGVSESLWLCMVSALLASTMGQIGDLAESLVKRFLGVKDFSNLIPGHGGMFDRADSILFSVPTAFLCVYLATLL